MRYYVSFFFFVPPPMTSLILVLLLFRVSLICFFSDVFLLLKRNTWTQDKFNVKCPSSISKWYNILRRSVQVTLEMLGYTTLNSHSFQNWNSKETACNNLGVNANSTKCKVIANENVNNIIDGETVVNFVFLESVVQLISDHRMCRVLLALISLERDSRKRSVTEDISY